MTPEKKHELAQKLRECNIKNDGNEEFAHIEADDLLIKYINDREVTEAYEAIVKWYC